MQAQQIDTIADELAAIARREYDNAMKTVIHKALDTGRCPECDGSGIAVEYDPETWQRREVKCECGAQVIGRFFCAWCKRILEECAALGESGGICPICRDWLMGGTINERA